MKAIITICCAAATILVAAACNNNLKQDAKGAAVDHIDTFDRYRRQVTAELADAENIQAFLKDSIVLPEHGSSDFVHLNLADQSVWPSFQFSIYTGNKKLFLYNADRKSIAYTIDLSRTNPEDEVMNCYVNNDTIYAIKKGGNDMYCFDLRGELIKTYHFPDTSKEMGCRLTACAEISDLMVNKNNDMAMFMIPYLRVLEKAEQNKSAKNKPIALVHIGTDSVTVRNKVGNFPKEYLKDYYRETRYRFININDSNIAYLFLIHPELNIQNTYTGKQEQHPIKGLPTNNVLTYTEDMSTGQNFSYTNEYALMNDSYINLVYDKEKKRFYIFRGLGIAPVNKDGLLALYVDRPVILYVIDANNFSVIKKLYCGVHGKYSWYSRPQIYKSKLYMLRQKGERKKDPVKIDIYDIP